MAYIGSIPAYQASGVRPRDEFTADGTQICFPLSQSVPGSFESGVTIVLDNVPQQPVEAFTVVDTRTLTLTSISGTFTVNETITGATSAATGTVIKVNLNNIVIRGLTGTFSSSEGITGGTSAATATTTSVTINTGSGILFSEAPTAASIIYVVHEGNATYNLVPTAASVGPSQLADNLRNFTVDTFTGNGSTTTFTLSDTPSSANSLLVMVDGIVQTRTTNYTLSGAVVTFTDAPDSSAAITIIHLGFSTISRTGLVDGSVTTSKIADNAITSAKLGFDVIVAEDIAANAITVAEIASGAVTTAKLATDLVVTHALGSASTPSITFTGDTNTGIFSPTADVIAFAEGGVESMRIDSSGNIGIGDSSPAYKLTVNGTVYAYSSSSSATFLSQNTGGAWFANAQGSDYAITESGVSEWLRVKATTGNVGIGTSSPSGKLDVRAGASALVGNFQSNTGVPAYIAVGDGTVTGYLQGDANQSVVKVGSLTNYPLLFQTNNTERMRIDSSGQLLINRTNTSQYTKLAVAGAIRVNNNIDQSANNTGVFGMFFAKGSTTVTGGAGATTIKPSTGSEAAFYLVTGLGESNKRFFDIVVTMGAGLCTVLNSGGIATPPTRTYTSTAETLSLSITGSSSPYSVSVTGFGANESS